MKNMRQRPASLPRRQNVDDISHLLPKTFPKSPTSKLAHTRPCFASFARSDRGFQFAMALPGPNRRTCLCEFNKTATFKLTEHERPAQTAGAAKATGTRRCVRLFVGSTRQSSPADLSRCLRPKLATFVPSRGRLAMNR